MTNKVHCYPWYRSDSLVKQKNICFYFHIYRIMFGNSWDKEQAAVFCVVCAGLYVGSMYLIPESVRALPRDNVVHVRTFVHISSAIF